MVSPGVKYSAEHAKRKILQMPLVCVCVGEPFSGKSFCILIEKFQFCDYSKFGVILNSLISKGSSSPSPTLEKSIAKMLLRLAKSDSERKRLRYAIVKSSGMTPTSAR